MQLNELNLNYSAIAPELIASITGVVIMLVDAFSKKGARRANALIALIGLVAALGAIAGLWAAIGDGPSFGGMIVVDRLRLFFSIIVILAAIITALLASQFLRDEALPPGEFYALLMFATTGMLLMTAAGDLVMIFLGLEISSITTYVLGAATGGVMCGPTNLRSNISCSAPSRPRFCSMAWRWFMAQRVPPT